MNESESYSRLTDDLADMKAEVQSVQTMLSVSLILFLVFTICINIFLAFQMLNFRTQVHRSGANASLVLTTKAPAMIDFYNKMNDFAAKHPDFKPIFAKYGQYFNEPDHKYLTGQKQVALP